MDAERWDQLLDAYRAPLPSPVLRARVLAAAPRPPTWSSVAGRWMRAWAPGAGLAAAGLAGVLFGVVLSGSGLETSADTLLAEAGPYDEAVLNVDGGR